MRTELNRTNNSPFNKHFTFLKSLFETLLANKSYQFSFWVDGKYRGSRVLVRDQEFRDVLGCCEVKRIIAVEVSPCACIAKAVATQSARFKTFHMMEWGYHSTMYCKPSSQAPTVKDNIYSYHHELLQLKCSVACRGAPSQDLSRLGGAGDKYFGGYQIRATLWVRDQVPARPVGNDSTTD